MAVVSDGVAPHDIALSVVILCAEETVRAAIAYWATVMPVQTVVAEDGYQASQALRNGDCRLIVTDRVLPPWPGLDTFRDLRERIPGLRIAFVEGASHQDVSLARVAGVTHVIPRPLRRQTVVDTIVAAIRPS